MFQAVMVGFLLVAMVIDGAMLAFAVTRTDRSRAICFAALSSYLFIYTFGYLLEIMCTTNEAAYIAICVENLGIPMIAPCFAITALNFFYPRKLKKWMLPAAVIYGYIIFLLVLATPLHNLYYTSIDIVYQGAYHYVKLGRGVFYYLQQGVTVFLMALTYFVLFKNFFSGTKKLRKQMMLFLIGSLVAFSGNLLNFTGWLPLGIDPTPFTITIGLIFFSVDIFFTRVLDIASVAFDSAVETMNDALIVLDSDGGFIYCNTSAKGLFPELTSYAVTELITQVCNWPTELIIDGEEGVTAFRKETGEEKRSYSSSISKVCSSRGKLIGWSMVIRDNTDMNNMVEKLEMLATTDPLTGIFNRRQFMLLVKRDLEMARRHNLAKGLVIFDIDNFKNINDTYGHQVGDEILLAITNAVSNQLRSYDLFARYGGEEFIVFTTADTGRDNDLFAFAERIRKTVEQASIKHEDKTVSVTASFGTTIIEAGDDFDVATRCADIAMYEAKTLGRNRTVFKPIIRKTS